MNKNKILIITIIALVVIQCCTQKYIRHVKGNFKIEHSKSEECFISGIIKSKIDFTPLPNTTIYFNNGSEYYQSDENGLFRVSNLKEGSYNLTFKCVGHDSLKINKLYIKTGESLFLKIDLGYILIF